MMSSGVRFAVFGFGQGVGRFSVSHALAFQGDAVGVVDDPIQDGVGDGATGFRP